MSESIALSRSLGGVADTRLELWSPTFEEMASNLGRPTVGKKDGPYFVRGPFNGVAARADEHIAEANVVILDADKRIDPGTGELHVGAPHPSMVHEALRDGDVQHVIYTSHSHGSEMGNRYRIVVPARMGSDHRALLATVDHLIDVIADAGILLAPASENYGWSQPWYLPRLRSGGAEFLHYVHDTDERLDVHKIVTQWLKGQPPDVDVAPQVPTRPNSGASLIDRYVRQHNDPSVLALWL